MKKFIIAFIVFTSTCFADECVYFPLDNKILETQFTLACQSIAQDDICGAYAHLSDLSLIDSPGSNNIHPFLYKQLLFLYISYINGSNIRMHANFIDGVLKDAFPPNAR